MLSIIRRWLCGEKSVEPNEPKAPEVSTIHDPFLYTTHFMAARTPSNERREWIVLRKHDVAFRGISKDSSAGCITGSPEFVTNFMEQLEDAMRQAIGEGKQQ